MENVTSFFQDVNEMSVAGSIEVKTKHFHSLLEASSNMLTILCKADEVAKDTKSRRIETVEHDAKPVMQNIVQVMENMALTMELGRSEVYTQTTDNFVMKTERHMSTKHPIRLKYEPNGPDGILVDIPRSISHQAWSVSRNRISMSQIGRTPFLSVRQSAFFHFNSSKLFHSDRNVSQVIYGDLNGRVNGSILSKLDADILIRIPLNDTQYGKHPIDNTLQATKTDLKCVWWDFDKSGWSEEGCCLLVEPGAPQCLCHKLANFAVVIENKIVKADVKLSVVASIGCGFSIICFVLTAIAYAYNKSDEVFHVSNTIFVHVCINLAAFDLVFVLGIGMSSYPDWCKYFAFLLHWLVLTNFFWISAYAFDVYRIIKKIWLLNAHRYMQVIYGLAYLGPLLIAAVNFGISIANLDELTSPHLCFGARDQFATSAYRADNMCWVHDNSLLYGLLLPCGVLLFIIMYMFVSAFVQLVFNQGEVSGKPDKSRNPTHNLMVIIIFFTTGFDIVITYLYLYTDAVKTRTATGWLLAVANVTQGMGVFVVAVLRRPHIRSFYALWSNDNRVEEFTPLDEIRPHHANAKTPPGHLL